MRVPWDSQSSAADADVQLLGREGGEVSVLTLGHLDMDEVGRLERGQLTL